MADRPVREILEDVDSALWNAVNISNRFLSGYDAEYFVEVRRLVNQLLDEVDGKDVEIVKIKKL